MTVSSLYKRWECFAVGLYAICYSVAKSCSYWNSRTLHCIADQGNKLYRNMGINRCLKMADLYTSLDICGVKISFQLKAQSYEMLSTSLNNTKNKLENLIFNNYSGNTGFLLWLASYCITGIFQQKNSQSKVHVFLIDLWRYLWICNTANKNKWYTTISISYF